MADEEQPYVDPDDVQLAEAPGNRNNERHPGQDLLGILPGDGRSETPGAPLLNGETDIQKWAPRGIRTKPVAHAEVVLQQENEVLVSQIIRGTTMKRIMIAEPIRTMYRGERKQMDKWEFLTLAVMFGGLAAFVFIIANTLGVA